MSERADEGGGRASRAMLNSWTDAHRQKLEDAITHLERGKFVLDGGKRTGTVLGPGTPFPPDPRWTRVWGYLGELILPMWHFALDNPVGAGPALRTFAGDEERAVHQYLDAYARTHPDADVRGQRVIESLVKAVDDAWRDWQTHDPSTLLPDLDVTQEQVVESTKMLAIVRNEMIAAIATACGLARPDDAAADTDAAADGDPLARKLDRDAKRKKTWLALNNRLPRRAIPGMIYLARSLGGNLLPHAVFTQIDVDKDYFSTLTDPRIGLPPELAKKFIRKEFLSEHKQRVEAEGYLDSGIEEPGTTELDRDGAAYLFSAKANTSVMVLAPTSSGKSRFGQIAIMREVHEKKRQHRRAYGKVVVIVPTKALVTQFARELRELLAGTEGDEWTVLEGSRDYPQHDDRIRASRFDITVIIPEKLAALMRNGMKIERTPLVLVDELQHLTDGQRGLKEEQLLIDIFGRPSPPRFIGLSASLDPATSELLQRWFAANGLGVDLLEMTARPVPLTVTVVGEERRIESRTHILGDRTDLDVGLPVAAGIATQAGDLPSAQRYRMPLALLLEMLGANLEGETFGGDTPSVLVFVDSRRHAEELVGATGALIPKALGVPEPRMPRGREQPSTRFSAFPEAEDLPHPAQSIRLLPPGRIRDLLTDAMRSGIGFHTASLNQAGRAVIETMFRRGYVRVMFATDTLKLGINLPADVVVNADMHVYVGGGGARLVSKDTLIQRLGRAGRLGHSRSLGQGFLVARRPPDHARVDAHERWEITGREDATEVQVREAVGTIEGLYDAYIRNWSGGAHYTRPIDPAWFDQVVAQRIEGRPGRALPAADLERELSEMFARSLAGADGADRPDAAAVVERLTAAGAIALDDDVYRLTDVGWSAAVNALTTLDTQWVKRIAAAAQQGAGPLTLIYLACRSWHVTTTVYPITMQVGDRPEVVDPALDRLRQGVPHSGLPRNRTTFLRHFPDSVPDIIGTGAEADELRRLIDVRRTGVLDQDAATHLTAVWRAFHIYLRWTGLEFASMENILERKADRWRIDESTLASLGEGTAYILNAASDLLGMNPESMQFRSLGFFATEVELGMPALLAPFLYLNTRGMDRERILGMRAIIKESHERWDGLAELFDIYVDKYQTIPRRNHPDWIPLPDDVVEKIREELAEYDANRRGTAYRVVDEVGDLRVPGRPGRTVRDDLDQVARGQGGRVLYDALTGFGLTADLNLAEDRVTVVFPNGDDDASPTVFVVPPRGVLVDNAFIDGIVDELDEGANAMVVAVDGASHGAINRGRFLQDPVAIIDPALLLELLAKVHKRNADETTDPEDEDAGVYGMFGIAPPPRLDLDAAQEELRRLFLRNAPVLSRNDLENRLAYREIVAE